MKLFAAAIFATAIFAIPTAVSADDTVCSEGYELVQSAGGPLCVNPLYLTGWEDDPATCTNGFYQGSCVPAEYTELPPVVFEPEGYTYQQIPTQTPAAAVAVVEVFVNDDAVCRLVNPC